MPTKCMSVLFARPVLPKHGVQLTRIVLHAAARALVFARTEELFRQRSIRSREFAIARGPGAEHAAARPHRNSLNPGSADVPGNIRDVPVPKN